MAAGFPGGNNTYVPTLELSGNLQVMFSRNVKKYPVNRYVSLTSVKQPRGAYLYFNPLDIGRERNLTQGPKWAPGTPRPTGFHNTLGFEQKTFQTTRYNFSITLDQRAIDIANWDVQKTHSEALAQQAMTHKSYTVCKAMTLSTNYPTAHNVSCTSLGGGFADAGTTAAPYLFKAIQAGKLLIQKATGGRIQPHEISLLMNNTSAAKIASSREIREYVMQSPDAKSFLALKEGSVNGGYGLPPDLYNTPIVIEDLYYNPGPQLNASEAYSPIFPDNEALLFVRQGDLESSEGAASFSTAHLFSFEDMTVETEYDKRNRLLFMDVCDEFDVKIVAPVSAVRITNLFS